MKDKQLPEQENMKTFISSVKKDKNVIIYKWRVQYMPVLDNT